MVQLRFPPLESSWAADGPYCKNESYILNVILPHIRSTLGAGPISLLGFAQGGWGAVSLLLRHADVFHKAASWDAPLLPLLPDARLPGMCETFMHNGHYEHYVLLDVAEDGYVAAQLGSTRAAAALRAAGAAVPASYSDAAAAAAEEEPRLGLFGGLDHSNADDAMFLSRVLTSAGVPHVYEDQDEALNLHVPRGWRTGWLGAVLDFLLRGSGRRGAEAYADMLEDEALCAEMEAQLEEQAAAAEAAGQAAAADAALSSGDLGHEFAGALDMGDEDDAFLMPQRGATGARGGGAADVGDATSAWSASDADSDADQPDEDDLELSNTDAAADMRDLDEEGAMSDLGLLR